MDKSENRFPKLLMVTAFSPAPLSGGALLRQLLRGFPSANLHWWTAAPEAAAEQDPDGPRIHVCPLPRRLTPYRRFTRLKSWLVERLWLPKAARHLRQTAAEVQPGTIWCQMTGWGIPVFHRAQLTGRYRTHVSLWDYHNSQMHHRFLGTPRALRFTRLSETLLREATSCDAISHPMKADLEARIGRSDLCLVHSGFEPQQLERLAAERPEAPSQIRIAYAGSIIAPDTFALFLRALEAVRASLGRPLRLDFFSKSFRGEPWFNPEWMTDHGFLEEERFEETLRECSWGFAPMNLDDADAAYNRYSFPNKFGTYLAAGLPLVVLAHRESSAARMFRDYPAGVCSDTLDLETLSAFLRQALREPNPKGRHRAEILRCARTEFDAAEIRRRLWRCLGLPES